MIDLTALTPADLLALADAIDDEFYKRGSSGVTSHVSGTCRASIGRRKVSSLVDHTRTAQMQVTLVARSTSPDHAPLISANCWIDDADGRRFGLVLEPFLLAEIVGSYHYVSAASRQTPVGL